MRTHSAMVTAKTLRRSPEPESRMRHEVVKMSEIEIDERSATPRLSHSPTGKNRRASRRTILSPRVFPRSAKVGHSPTPRRNETWKHRREEESNRGGLPMKRSSRDCYNSYTPPRWRQERLDRSSSQRRNGSGGRDTCGRTAARSNRSERRSLSSDLSGGCSSMSQDRGLMSEKKRRDISAAGSCSRIKSTGKILQPKLFRDHSPSDSAYPELQRRVNPRDRRYDDRVSQTRDNSSTIGASKNRDEQPCRGGMSEFAVRGLKQTVENVNRDFNRDSCGREAVYSRTTESLNRLDDNNRHCKAMEISSDGRFAKRLAPSPSMSTSVHPFSKRQKKEVSSGDSPTSRDAKGENKESDGETLDISGIDQNDKGNDSEVFRKDSKSTLSSDKCELSQTTVSQRRIPKGGDGDLKRNNASSIPLSKVRGSTIEKEATASSHSDASRGASSVLETVLETNSKALPDSSESTLQELTATGRVRDRCECLEGLHPSDPEQHVGGKSFTNDRATTTELPKSAPKLFERSAGDVQDHTPRNSRPSAAAVDLESRSPEKRVAEHRGGSSISDFSRQSLQSKRDCMASQPGKVRADSKQQKPREPWNPDGLEDGELRDVASTAKGIVPSSNSSIKAHQSPSRAASSNDNLENVDTVSCGTTAPREMPDKRRKWEVEVCCQERCEYDERALMKTRQKDLGKKVANSNLSDPSPPRSSHPHKIVPRRHPNNQSQPDYHHANLIISYREPRFGRRGSRFMPSASSRHIRPSKRSSGNTRNEGPIHTPSRGAFLNGSFQRNLGRSLEAVGTSRPSSVTWRDVRGQEYFGKSRSLPDSSMNRGRRRPPHFAASTPYDGDMPWRHDMYEQILKEPEKTRPRFDLYAERLVELHE